MSICRIVRLTTCLVLGTLSVEAQFSITPLKTFGTGGWLAPNGVNGSSYAYLTTSDTERGMAYGNDHLYLVSRNGGNFIRILDAQTGKDLGALNLGSGLVSGGTFDINAIAVGGDGAVYLANLAVGPTAFRVYRWANDLPATTPSLVYNGVPLAGARIGDNLTAIGSGGLTRLAAGFNSTPSVAGDNGYAIIDPSAGTAVVVGFSGTPPAAGDFRLGISFTDSSHVVGTQGGGGSSLLYSSFSGTNGTLLSSPTLASTDERPLSFGRVDSFALLAGLSTTDNHVSLYDMTDPAQPVLVGQNNATSGTLPADAHNTGALAWGSVSGNTATLYALASDDGIQAFTVTVPSQTPAAITSQPQDQSVLELAPVTFSVGASGIPAPTYQWSGDDGIIAGATNPVYTIPSAAFSQNGAHFLVVAQNMIAGATYSATSRVAVLAVVADTSPPRLLSAQSLGLSRVEALFSKRMSPVTATYLLNYAMTGAGGALAITSAALDSSQSNIVLEVSGMAEGTTYTLTVNRLADQSALGNIIPPNSKAEFVAGPFTWSGIGNPAMAGSQTVVSGGYDFTVGGLGFGGVSDEGVLSYQLRSGDFDVAVRLAGLSPSDVWAKAGLMARESLDPGSRFAAALATPAMIGAFFEWRASASSASQTSGQLAGNFPNTWLRLRRTGNSFTGFGSWDGQTWKQLGNAVITLPSQVYLGLAACSHSASQTTTAQFRDVTEVKNGLEGAVASPYEPLGPSSRRTPLVISELMYSPAPRSDGRNLEFVELYNSSPWWEDISGYRLTGDIVYTIPSGTILPGGAFLVVAVSPADLVSVYGISNVFGPAVDAERKTGLIQLLDEQDAVLLEFSYSKVLPWPAGADGTGHSIVLARPSYGEGDPRAWTISDQVGGSPGTAEAYRPSPLRDVRLNEFLANPDASHQGFVELYNHNSSAVDLSGCVLTDDAQTNKFAVPPNTVISPGGFAVFDTAQLGFGPSPGGGLLLFKTPDSSRVLDAVSYEAQGLNVSYGRWPDGAGEFYPMSSNTPGAHNSDIQIGDVVLNEIMYKPISRNDDDQYVELYNQGTQRVDVSGWSFTAGIHFTFAPGTALDPGAYLVVARNLTNLVSHYPQLNSSNTVGNFTGKLGHTGERLALARPEQVVLTDVAGVPSTKTILVVEDEVTYGVGGRWGQWAHGGGSSLELINPRTNHRLPDNWADSDETGKSVWTNLEYTGVLDNGANYGSGIDLVQVGLLDVGEGLVDDLEVHPGGSDVNYIANPNFENGLGNWTPQGDHLRSSLETTLGGYQSSQCLHLRASDGMWALFNSVQGTLTNTTLHSGQMVTLRLKGRWLRGSPEILMRLHGDWLELTGAFPIPQNLGTPGQPNSQASAVPGPSIFEVQHSPAIPVAGQPLLVTARFHDVHGVQPTLLYRVDTGLSPTPTYKSISLEDNGAAGDVLAGDGLYSARIPAQPSGTVVAFMVRAQNSLGGLTVFPKVLNDNSGLPRECVVRFGDPAPLGSFDHEHVWMTQNWVNRWSSLGGLSNENHDGTFVDGNSGRIIYNWVGRPAGSPYHQYAGSPVTTLGGEHWTMPDDDKFLGSTSFNKQHLPGNGPLDDNTLQREQTSFWMARQVGVPWLYRRFYILYVNGNRHGPLMEDTQIPGADMIAEHWPNDSDGFLYKNNSWFEGAPTLDGSGHMDFKMPTWCLLGRYTTTVNGSPGQYKLARYRPMYWIRQYPDSANNFTNIYALISAANLPSSDPAYDSGWEALADTEEFMRMSALEHATGDWDSWFTQNQWNMYIYKPSKGKWTALKWDWNITLGGGTSTWPADGSQLFNFGPNDPIMARFQNFIPHKRAYLRAFKEIADRAMNNVYVDPVLDKKYAAFAANGLTASSQFGLRVQDPGASLKSWIATMHKSLLRALTNQGVAGLSFGVDASGEYLTGTNVVLLTGTAPVEVKSILLNEVPMPVTWTSVKSWQMTVPLYAATNALGLQALDWRGNVLSNLNISLSVINTNAGPPTLRPVSINEWMAKNDGLVPDPADGAGHDWFELYNPNSAAVDLSGFFLTDQLDTKTQWQIPPGTVLPNFGFVLVWADGGLSGGADRNLHANFHLAKAGGSIGLFTPTGDLVDSVTFGPQQSNVSQGRWPDGGAGIYFLTEPTPNAPNALIQQLAIRAIGLSPQGQASFSWNTQAGRTYRVEWKSSLNDPAWQTIVDLLASGSSLTFSDPAPTGFAQRFYRVSQL